MSDKKSQKLVVSAFLFDMDGTLVDSTAIVERAWAVWSQRHNLDLKEVLAYSHGRPTLTTMQYFGDRYEPGKDWQAEADEMQDYEVAGADNTAPIPGAPEILATLKNAPWAVVTSAPRALAESRIRAAGLRLPRILVPADEITLGKPDPEGFLKAARQLGHPPAECLVFEDTPPGVEAGLSAGAQVIGLLTTVAAERLATKHLIRNYHDLSLRVADGKFEVEIRNA